MIWHAIEAAATYSAYGVDYTSVACFFDLQVVTLDRRVKSLAKILSLSSNDPAQLLYVDPYNLKLEDIEYQISYFIV